MQTATAAQENRTDILETIMRKQDVRNLLDQLVDLLLTEERRGSLWYQGVDIEVARENFQEAFAEEFEDRFEEFNEAWDSNLWEHWLGNRDEDDRESLLEQAFIHREICAALGGKGERIDQVVRECRGLYWKTMKKYAEQFEAENASIEKH